VRVHWIGLGLLLEFLVEMNRRACREVVFSPRLCLCAKFSDTIREDRTPNLLLMRYALATWEVRDLLLIPSLMFSESAVIQTEAALIQARRAGWVAAT